MAVIKLIGMEFNAAHGVYEEERINGNRFTVDVTFEADTTIAQKSDSISDTVDYGAVYGLVEIEMRQASNLLEHVAQRIKDRIQALYPHISKLQVAVTKHNPPIIGNVDRVTVVL